MQDRRDILNNTSINVVSQAGGAGLSTEVLSLAIPFAFLIGAKAVEEKGGGAGKNKNKDKDKKKSSKKEKSKTTEKQRGAGFFSTHSQSPSSHGSFLMPNSIVNQAYEMARKMNAKE